MTEYLAQKERILVELTLQRATQLELLDRKKMLAAVIDISRVEFDDIHSRLKDIDTKIKGLRGQL